ncbi:MAG: sulfatase [Akkermansiaceae bacterium]|nr:sulfatase [Akkermansiaceae bacterium]
MRFLLLLSILGLSTFSQAEKPNILLICVDDLRPELNCYGVDYIQSPHIDSLAKSGRMFTRHYVQAPTCGASRFTLLTGSYGGSDNGALFHRAKKSPPITSMPRHFREQGYTTVSVGKVSHHPGGRGGKDWNDESQPELPGAWDRHLMPSGKWQHPRGAMHGLAHGEIRENAKDMAVYQAEEGPDDIYPDGLITDEALNQLDLLAKEDKPFFLAVGIIRPHLPFGAPAKYLEPYEGLELPPIPHPEKPEGLSTWHGSGEFRKYKQFGKDIYTDADHQEEVRRHYAACVTYADAQVGRVLEKVDSLGLRDNTIIVLWGDHGWHLGEHAIWGKHSLYEESLRSPLIFSHPSMPKPGEATDAIVESCDIFPTLCELTDGEVPENLDGKSVQPILENPETDGDYAISYHNKQVTVRTDQYRLIWHQGGRKGKDGVELYDHSQPHAETRNLAQERPEVVEELKSLIQKARP